MTDFNLRKELATLKDKRRGQAQRHKIDVVLMRRRIYGVSGISGFKI